MHELGHAEDLSQQINFDNVARTMNVLSAEVYAHKFVCRYAKRFGYRLALEYYLDNFEASLKSEDDVTRWAAERTLNELDIVDLRRASSMEGYFEKEAMTQRMKKAGRLA